MNFREFKLDRAAKLEADPTLIDLGETHIWSALAELVPALEENEGPHVHRCGLAKAWLAAYGLPEAWARRALVSTGVRNSLSLMLAAIAESGRRDGRAVRWWLPEDVYPVYGDLARTAGLTFETYPTIPLLLLPDSSSANQHAGEWLLIPNPLKPAGRWITNEEAAELKRWLAADASRRVVIDAVYTFETQFAPATIQLLETGQAILLHSLSKGWLHAQVFGVALVPEIDLALYADAFRANSPPQSTLQLAWQLLNDYPAARMTIAEEIIARRERLLAFLPADVRERLLFPARDNAAGYLLVVRSSAEELFQQHHVLTIPFSVFGSSQEDYCVTSALAATQGWGNRGK